jgi:hypothetical protein
MTPKQVALVQDSFAKVALSEATAVLFYDRLFEIAPQMSAMFPADMIEQRRKLMEMPAAVVWFCRPPAHWQSGMSATVRRRGTIRWSAPRCCGRWRRAWGMAGRRKWRMRGVPLMARCQAT